MLTQFRDTFTSLIFLTGWSIIGYIILMDFTHTLSESLLLLLGIILTGISIIYFYDRRIIAEKEVVETKSKLQTIQNQLCETTTFYDMVLGQVPIDIVAFDQDHKYLLLTEKSIKDTELRKWMIGKDDYDYVAYRNKPVAIADNRRKLFNMARDSAEAVKWEDHNILPDGADEYLLRMFQPVFDNGEFKYMLGVAWDITEQKLAENKMRAAKEEAEQASKAKANFLSMMSHEIRTPMNAVIAMTEWMLAESPRTSQQEPLEIIKFSGENLMVLINDILDFSKIEAGKVELEQTDVHLAQLVKNILGSYRNTDDGKQFELIDEVDPNLQNYVIGDPTRISQVLTNFVSNAVKFTTEGSIKVLLTVQEQTESQILIDFEISDTGIGIATEKLELIFDPFSQAESSTTRKFGGTGLGLSITHQLISLMGGEVKVESKVGVGTSFRFSLQFPKGQRIGASQINPDQAPVEKNLDRLKILAVEDHPVNGKVLMKFLKKWKSEPTWVTSGQEALTFLESPDFPLPEVILMDLQMPEMDGYETTRRIRNMGGELQQIPIIALSANAINDVKKEVYSSGMNGFIPKPFRPSLLFDTLTRHQPQTVGDVQEA